MAAARQREVSICLSPMCSAAAQPRSHVFTGCHPLQLQLCSEIDLAVLENASLVGLEEVQARPTRLLVFLWCRRVGVAEVEVERLAESLNAWDATTAAHNAERLDRIATQPQVDGFWTQASEVMMPIRPVLKRWLSQEQEPSRKAASRASSACSLCRCQSHRTVMYCFR